ncbi:transcription factor LHW isoform X2 [Canna indica]|uniref:Transcription factor LHW isoform X2 n=1 Tax=Canna indica TaxID=4628 RepID=A0AAQ3QKD0_9LILI|nr:transcription factor LHW isoform X2 [Canna indica]
MAAEALKKSACSEEGLLSCQSALFALRGGALKAPPVVKLVDGWPAACCGGGGGEVGARKEERRRGADHAGRTGLLPRQLGPYVQIAGVLRHRRFCLAKPLREALRRLCLDFGWSYAVFWRATGSGSRMHLIWEDGRCDRKPEISRFIDSDFPLKEQAATTNIENKCSGLGCHADDAVRIVVDKIMAAQVHVVGDGLIGRAASVGKYLWINKDTLDVFGSTPKDFAEMNCQIAAGIQTTVIIPMLPSGVVQLGSTELVMENITFINHVKSTFSKLNCGSGSLSSNNAHKALREKCQAYSSDDFSFACQSTNVCTTVDDKFSVIANECIPKLIKSTSPRCFSESLCAVSSQWNKRMQPSASELMPSKHTGKMTYPLCKYILQGAEENFPKLDSERTQQVPSAVSSSKCQNELSVWNSGLLFNSLKVLEEELMFTSAVGTLESTDKSASKNAADFGNAGSTLRPCGVTELSSSSAKLAVIGEPPTFCRRSHSLGDTCISDISKDQPYALDKVPQAVSNAATVRQKGYLIQTSCTSSSKTGVQVSCSDMLPGIIQEYGLCDSKVAQTDQICQEVDHMANNACPTENKHIRNLKEYKLPKTLKDVISPLPLEFSSGNDLFGMLGFDHKAYWSNGSLDDVLEHKNITDSCNSGTEMSNLPVASDACTIIDSLDDQFSCSGLFSVEDSDQLLDAVISKINSGAKHGSDDSVSCKSTSTDIHSSHNAGTSSHGEVFLSKHMKDVSMGFTPALAKRQPSSLSYGKSSCSFEKDGEYAHKVGLHKSQISSWVESCQSTKIDCASDSNSKRVGEIGKLNRKRPRPGESPRPRPKDRQMIQDRIKELREIVPNGTKCSIDALLEKTIKHMLFLQSVTKHADDLKVAGEPKISNEEGGLLLKENFDGGATWAFEVGTQPMICPIVVEDLNPPRQMLVEMLCEERGSFLEIADFIRGLGLTILKGVMEARKSKIWARFAVEANRDVTRMEIFISLVQLLEPTAGGSMALPTGGNTNMPHTMFQQSSIPARVI